MKYRFQDIRCLSKYGLLPINTVHGFQTINITNATVHSSSNFAAKYVYIGNSINCHSVSSVHTCKIQLTAVVNIDHRYSAPRHTIG